jgi:DNA repair/transcription protein MET18/MMS19
VLEAFAQLSNEKQIFDTLLLRLKNKYDAAKRLGAALGYQHALLLAILYCFACGSPMPDEEGLTRSTYFTDYAESLLDLGQSGSDAGTLNIVGRIWNVVLKSQSLHFQSSVYHRNFDRLSVTSSDSQSFSTAAEDLVPFTLYYYAALRAEVVEAEDIVNRLQNLGSLVSNEGSHRLNRTPILRYIALIVNKFINPSAMQTMLERCGLEVESLLSQDNSPYTVEIASTVTRALVVQGKSGTLASKYLRLFQNLLSRPGKIAARQFSTLLAEDDVLTKANHCLVSGLYKQKTFNQCVPSIIEAVRTAEPEVKPNYLVALGGVLRSLPYSMLEPSLSSLVPPLLQTLDLAEQADNDVKASSLTIFEAVLMHNPDTVAEHTASLVTRLLNCTADQSNKANVRAKALQCLSLVPRQLKQEAVVPYRRQVTKRLMACLDDGKRNVRAEAVRCRTAWLGIDEGEDQD